MNKKATDQKDYYYTLARFNFDKDPPYVVANNKLNGLLFQMNYSSTNPQRNKIVSGKI